MANWDRLIFSNGGHPRVVGHRVILGGVVLVGPVCRWTNRSKTDLVLGGLMAIRVPSGTVLDKIVPGGRPGIV